MSIVVLSPGVHSTIQDLGRPGHRHAGVPSGGAIDPLALRAANLLVGNDENAATIECALVGPALRFERACRVALCGAQSTRVATNQSLNIRSGTTIDIGPLVGGTYAYLAIAGGFDVPLVMGSRSTDVRIAMGGFHGRLLARGDRLSRGRRAATQPEIGTRVHLDWIGNLDPIRVIRGSASREIGLDWIAHTYTISSTSDRMGVRLKGRGIDVLSSTAASSPVLPGTLQLPGDGQPIVLLNDAQTLGGYPQLGHVIASDLPRLAQQPPGSTLRFISVSIGEARAINLQQNRAFAFLRYRLTRKEE